MTEIFMRIMNIVERVRSREELNQMAMVVFGAIFVFGLLNCILGYRVLRFWMMLFGLAMGAGLGAAGVYLTGMGMDDKKMYLAAMGIAGIVLAVISFLVYRAGIFVIGAGIGLALSIYILHPTSSATFFLCILIGVGLGVLALRYAREVIIVGTSLLGGVLAGISLAKLGGLEEIPYGVGMSIGFALLGMLIQFAINRPEDDEEDEEGEEEEYTNEEKDEYEDALQEEFDNMDYEELEALEEELEKERRKERKKKS